jgi:hypothetical protein
MSATYVIGKREAVLKAIEAKVAERERVRLAPKRGVLRNLAGLVFRRLAHQH